LPLSIKRLGVVNLRMLAKLAVWIRLAGSLALWGRDNKPCELGKMWLEASLGGG
jgi:hypothetical protein